MAKGYLLTNHHAAKDAANIQVWMGKRAHIATVVKADAANDIALLKIADLDGVETGILPLLPSRDVRLGDSVATVGYPNIGLQGIEPKLTRGEINSLSGVRDDLRYFQMSVQVQPGNSGGPLVDIKGNVIGLVSARLDDMVALETSGSLPQNVNYALKSSFVLAFLDTIPDLAGKLKAPYEGKECPFADMVKEIQAATALIVVY